MNKNKLKHFQSLLENIYIEIVGDVEKAHHNKKSNEVQQMADISDDAARSYGKKLHGDLEEQEWVKLKQVEAALKKVEDGEYGICEQCEQEILETRLEIMPYTEFCIQCLSEIEKNTSLDNQKTQFTKEP
ncbi:MAG: TraR/DksA C4-type zinc finger protein [Nitrospinaceae bacterium]|nr:TraR/DksA C4-type zinc finger protein [Nitrospinaceae bacterium]